MYVSMQGSVSRVSDESTDYSARRDPNTAPNLLAMTGDAHAHRRRLWNRGMSNDSLKEYEDIISKRARQLVDRLESIKGSIDLAEWLAYFA